MTDKTIILGNKSNGSFVLIHSRKSKYNLEHFLTFDPDLYWIYKSTNIPREVTYEDFLDFKFCRYIFFNKELYKREDINKWIEIMKSCPGSVWFLSKPLPPIYIIDRIKIKK